MEALKTSVYVIEQIKPDNLVGIFIFNALPAFLWPVMTTTPTGAAWK